MKILYFSWIREKVGVAEEVIDLPDHVSTTDQLIDYLSSLSDGHASAFEDKDWLRIAVDQRYSRDDDVLTNDAEVAIFPPVTGG